MAGHVKIFGIFKNVSWVSLGNCLGWIYGHSARQNCLVCVASASALWTGFPTTQDCRRLEIWSLNALMAIGKFTPPPPNTTQTGLSCRVWRAVWIGHNAHSTAPYLTRQNCRVASRRVGPWEYSLAFLLQPPTDDATSRNILVFFVRSKWKRLRR